MKLAIWTNSPSPHQRDFFAALRASGVDLCVRYASGLRAYRRQMGWSEESSLPPNETIIPDPKNPLATVEDFDQRVHILTGYAYAVTRRLVGQLSRRGVPWAHWSECSMPSWRSPLMWPLKRWYAGQVNQNALGAFAQGEMAAADFRRWGIRRERISHLYYSIEHPPLPKPDPETQQWLRGRNAVAFVGAMIPRKDPLLLVRAFAAARQNDQQALVMVGGGPLLDGCRRAADRLDLSEHVLFLGASEMARVPAVLAACHSLALPSRHDGWGMALNEGAAAGLALIASHRVGAARNLIEPGHNGVIHQARDCRSLTEALRPYLMDRDLARKHGRRSMAILESHTPERNAQRCVDGVQAWLMQSDRWAHWRGAWRPQSVDPGPHANQSTRAA